MALLWHMGGIGHRRAKSSGASSKQVPEGRCYVEPFDKSGGKATFSPIDKRNATHYAAWCGAEVSRQRAGDSGTASADKTNVLQDLPGSMLYRPMPLLIAV
jgi:hypothetical protein